jgi:hypothetical protein
MEWGSPALLRAIRVKGRTSLMPAKHYTLHGRIQKHTQR